MTQNIYSVCIEELAQQLARHREGNDTEPIPPNAIKLDRISPSRYKLPIRVASGEDRLNPFYKEGRADKTLAAIAICRERHIVYVYNRGLHMIIMSIGGSEEYETYKLERLKHRRGPS